MSVCRSPARVPYFSDRFASSGDQENSPRSDVGDDLSYASEILESDTDLLPYSSRTFWAFGRLMPTVVIGPASPVSTTVSSALATVPLTIALRYFASYGMWSSNHCALSANLRMRAVFSWLT